MKNKKRQCPVCQSMDVNLHGSGSAIQATLDLVVSNKSPKFICRDCGAYFKRNPDRQYAQKMALVVGFGIIGVFAVLFSSDVRLVGMGKHLILTGYEAVYGDEHRSKLKDHWLWLYGSNMDSAVSDYERNK